MKRILATLALLALASGGLMATLAASAGATPPAPVPCALGPGTITTVANGTGMAVQDGHELKTPAVEDAVVWKSILGQPVTLASVTAMSYRATKLDDGSTNPAAMPAYRLYLDNGKTLYFEPYYQAGDHLDATGNPKLNTWTKFDVAAGKFWITGEGGGAYATNRTLDQLKAAFPDAKLAAVGVGQGTYNAGTVGRFKDVTITSTQPCVKPSASASGSASARPSASSSAPVAVPTLPVTGARPWVVGGVGLALVLVGGGAVAIARRRRTRFVS